MNYLIPNYIVQGNTLIKQMLEEGIITRNDNDKILSIFIYFWANNTQSNTINFTLEDMIIECGFVPRTKQGGINDRFKAILNYLNANEYLETNNYDFLSIKPKQFIKIKPKYFNIDDNNNRINYFILTDEEIEKIHNVSDVDNSKLLLYYATLKSRMWVKQGESDNKAQVCYATITNMSNDILLSEDIINQYNQVLANNGMIYYRNAGIFTKIENGKHIYKASANTYVLTSITNYKNEVHKSITSFVDYMKNNGFEKCKDISENKRKIAGVINRLETLEKQGNLSEENKIKLENARKYSANINISHTTNNSKDIDNTDIARDNTSNNSSTINNTLEDISANDENVSDTNNISSVPERDSEEIIDSGIYRDFQPNNVEFLEKLARFRNQNNEFQIETVSEDTNPVPIDTDINKIDARDIEDELQRYFFFGEYEYAGMEDDISRAEEYLINIGVYDADFNILDKDKFNRLLKQYTA